jgi:hypothetical protein
MYQEKIYGNDVINKMGHVFERFRFLMRSKSFKKDQIQKIDYHLTEIMKVLNECS